MYDQARVSFAFDEVASSVRFAPRTHGKILIETLLGQRSSGLVRLFDSTYSQCVFSQRLTRGSVWCSAVHPNFVENGLIAIGCTSGARLIQVTRESRPSVDLGDLHFSSKAAATFLATSKSDVFHQEFVYVPYNIYCYVNVTVFLICNYVYYDH